VTPQDFDYLRKFLRDRSGLVLAVEKQYLAESRLLPVARRNDMSTLDELIDRLKNRTSAPLSAEVVEAMTTNETFFFRDKIPFDHFRDTIMPTLIAARAREKRIRIWCTAASTGQEPYSLAMAIKSMGAAIAGYRIDIVATDLSSDVLEKAKAATYSQFEVQRGLPVQLLVKFFDQVGETWRLAPELRSMVQFRPLNLLNDFSVLGNFDIVFCRNVLIYFDQENKIAVLNRIARQMPVYATYFLVMALSSMGLPLLNGFIGEFLILQGVFQVNVVWTAIAATGLILGAIYLLTLVQKVFWGPITVDANRGLTDINGWEFAGALPLIFFIVMLGVYPAPLLKLVNGSANIAAEIAKLQVGR